MIILAFVIHGYDISVHSEVKAALWYFYIIILQAEHLK